MYTEDIDEDLPEDYYTEKELEIMYMGLENKARKSFQRSGPYRRQSFGRPRSSFRDLIYNGFRRPSQFDRSRVGDSKDNSKLN